MSVRTVAIPLDKVEGEWRNRDSVKPAALSRPGPDAGPSTWGRAGWYKGFSAWTWPPGRGDKEYHCINGIAGGRPARLLRADQGETMPLRSKRGPPRPTAAQRAEEKAAAKARRRASNRRRALRRSIVYGRPRQAAGQAPAGIRDDGVRLGADRRGADGNRNCGALRGRGAR